VQQGPPGRLGDGLLVAVAEAEAGGPAQQVVGQGGSQQPGGEAAGGQMRQAGARLQVADRQLADGRRRWSASSQVVVPTRLVTNAW
jgi:hypothetical protein